MRKEVQLFDVMSRQVSEKLTDYLASSEQGEGKVLQQKPIKALAMEMQLEKFIRKGGLNAQTLPNFLNPFLENSQHMHHPNYMGHQVAVPHWGSAMADFIHGAINNPMNIYEMGPSSATIEQTLIHWMLEKIGWYSSEDLTDFENGAGSGIITHGGSIANLTAMLAARAYTDPNAWENGVSEDLVVLGSEVSHYSTARAISIMGMGKKALWSVKVNENEVLCPKDLERVYQKAKAAGKKVMAVVANACATSTGLYDPIDKMADFCEKHNIWFHVDGAHGASALLSDKYKGLLNGVSRADSVTWDTHKMMRTSALCAAVLFRKKESVFKTFQQKGSYLYYEKENPGIDAMAHTLECTKAGIANKLFWVLASEGEKALGDFVESLYDKTRNYHTLIQGQPDFECPYYPESNILCFTYLSSQKENEFQLEIAKRVVLEGNYYITSAEVNGKRYLRFTLMNPLTETENIQGLMDEIRRVAKLIKEEAQIKEKTVS